MPYDLLTNIPNWGLLFIFPLGSCLLLLIFTLALKAFENKLNLRDYDSDILDTATQNTMSGAYVVLGFVLVLAMTTASNLDNAVVNEATQIKSMERLLVLEKSAAAQVTRQYLIKYTDSLINDEWPILKDGHGSQATSKSLHLLFLSLDQLNPKSPKETTIYSKILDNANQIAQSRNARIYGTQGNLPEIFYMVSALSLIGVLVICALRLLQATPLRSAAIVTQIAMLNLMFSAIVVIDLPYIGQTLTSSEPIEKALESIINRPKLHLH